MIAASPHLTHLNLTNPPSQRAPKTPDHPHTTPPHHPVPTLVGPTVLKYGALSLNTSSHLACSDLQEVRGTITYVTLTSTRALTLTSTLNLYPKPLPLTLPPTPPLSSTLNLYP